MTQGFMKTIVWSNKEPAKNMLWVVDDVVLEYIGNTWMVSPTVMLVDPRKSYVILEDAKFTKNDTYTAPEGKAYSNVTVKVRKNATE